MLQEAEGKCIVYGSIPSGKGGTLGSLKSYQERKWQRRKHTHFIVNKTKAQRKEETCLIPQSQRGTELVLASALDLESPTLSLTSVA